MQVIERAGRSTLALLPGALSITAFAAAALADGPQQGCVGTECTYQITTDTQQWGQTETTQSYKIIPYVPPTIPPPVVDNTPRATFSKVSAVRYGSKIKVSGAIKLTGLRSAELEAWVRTGSKSTGHGKFKLKDGRFSIAMPASRAKARQTVKIELNDGWPRTIRVK